MASYVNSIRRFKPSVILYILVSALMGFGYFGVSMVLFNLFLLRLNYSQEVIGVLNGTGQLAWAVFALPAAIIGRRLGLKKALVAGMVILTIGLTLTLFVEALPARLQEGWLFGWNFVVWIGAALQTVNSLPYLVGITQPEERLHALAISNAVSPLFAFAGSIVAGFLPGLVAGWMKTSLDQAAPFRTVLFLSPLAFLVGTWATFRLEPFNLEEHESSHHEASPLPLAIFLFFGLLMFLQSASEGAIRVYFNVHLDADLAVRPSQIGLILGLASLLPILGALAIPAIVARWGTKLAFALSTLLAAFTLVIMSAIPHPAAAALGFMSFSMLGNILFGVRGLLSQEIVEPRWRTTTSAIVILGLALGWGGMSMVGGALIGRVHFSGLGYISAGLAIISSLLMFLYIPFTSRVPVQAVALSSEGDQK